MPHVLLGFFPRSAVLVEKPSKISRYRCNLTRRMCMEIPPGQSRGSREHARPRLAGAAAHIPIGTVQAAKQKLVE
jgi:hypothetical protein